MRGDDIAERLLTYAARVVKMTRLLPRSSVGRYISDQAIRCSCSAGANYEEARGAESTADFVHKLGVALKEIRESRYWLRLLMRSEIVKAEAVLDLHKEADELCRILGQSILTARQRAKAQEKTTSTK